MHYPIVILLTCLFKLSKAQQPCPTVTVPEGFFGEKANVSIFRRWPVAFKATVSVISPADVQSWKIHLMFSEAVKILQVAKATTSKVNNKYFILTKAPWASVNLKYGERLDIEFIAYVDGQELPCITALFTWKGTITTLQPSTQHPSTSQIATTGSCSEAPSTGQITTEKPSTVQPSTVQPSTVQASTVQPSTGQPTPQPCPTVTVPEDFFGEKANVSIFRRWPVAFKATVSVISPGDVQSWKIHLMFSKTVKILQVAKATTSKVNNKYFILTRAPWASVSLKYGERLDIEFIAYVDGQELPCITALFTWKGTITTLQPPTQHPSTSQIATTGSFSKKPLTGQITTEKPSTVQPSTVQPSTVQPSTVQPSTVQPSTGQPTPQPCPTVTVPEGFFGEKANVSIFRRWPVAFKATMSVISPADVQRWKIHLMFSKTVKLLQVAKATTSKVNNKYFILTRAPWASVSLKYGERLDIEFIAYVDGQELPCITALFTWKGTIITLQPPTQHRTTPQIGQTSTDQPSTGQPSTDQPSTGQLSTYILTTDQPSSVHSSKQSTFTPSLTASTAESIFTRDCNKTLYSNETTARQTVSILVVDDWPQGFKATMKTNISDNIDNGWEIHLVFSNRVKSLTVWRVLKPNEMIGTSFVLKNMPWNKALKKDSILEVSFLAFKVKTTVVPDMCAVLVWKRTLTLPTAIPTPSSLPDTTIQITPEISSPFSRLPHSTKQPTSQLLTKEMTTTPLATKQATSQTSTKRTTFTTPLATTKPTSKYPYDYNEVLHKSILFYEAQRSGVLPSSNRIPWRGNSALKDRGSNGEDLTGGWYDAGDHVKFGFPMAFSTTLLTWGLLEYRDAYLNSGELQNMMNCIKWPLDYFIKAHIQPYVFYGQVGNGYVDHNYWGRAESMTMKRPAFKISKHSPGSDLAAETAAAMAAGSLAFREKDLFYSQTLLQHAKELYEFADKYQGLYSSSIPNAAGFYNSRSYKDELAWGALWLYKATNDKIYLQKAERYFDIFGMDQPGWGFSWDEKTGGVQLLLYHLTKKNVYKTAIKATLNLWLPGGGIKYTPKGLAWRLRWGPNRYAANTAFLALVAADSGLNSVEYRKFAQQQIHYMLGDNGRSFVVGFGKHPPMNPHHRGSSCKTTSSSCSIHDPTPNPNILYGALVGGPDERDKYKDDRHDYVMNEVATDYNAGFQSAVAALKSLEMRNE